ncbi:hypothetical protein [Chryseobacterium sp. 3008163]|uniref:hypothetical protein n=1 Tax=Chryseobacterium sp. 3008163 TaxID=2478663 RepID=UPI001E57CE2D|nr:hypothetical protein [Chryseobacterium sp. 3008163]
MDDNDFCNECFGFILIGLELPEIVQGLGSHLVFKGLKYGIIISLIVIALRFLWVYPAAHIPRFLFKSIRKNEPSPGWKGPLITSYAGMRGVVSLATALSIPIYLDDKGTLFPERHMIISSHLWSFYYFGFPRINASINH